MHLISWKCGKSKKIFFRKISTSYLKKYSFVPFPALPYSKGCPYSAPPPEESSMRVGDLETANARALYCTFWQSFYLDGKSALTLWMIRSNAIVISTHHCYKQRYEHKYKHKEYKQIYKTDKMHACMRSCQKSICCINASAAKGCAKPTHRSKDLCQWWMEGRCGISAERVRGGAGRNKSFRSQRLCLC